ncbi:hypothetical protein [Planomonospora sp. ID82291]|uniref:hypothetical protein n=1 Tax=Planomonospora sp. ID82291 TaxID=2738136 RepID=UPI0018C379FE|nr:hypothetical protein [Planomonospora sp. ID82291]MBG0814281.1 hypothetical protein [Planomonospora sp. ID82291]
MSRLTREAQLAVLRSRRHPYTDADLEYAVHLVAVSGAAALLAPPLAKPCGRPRLLTVEGLLTGLFLCALEHPDAMHLSTVTDILHFAVPGPWRRRFGVKDRADDCRGFEAAYAVVRRLFDAVLALLDPSPLPRNTRLSTETAAALRAQADPADLAGRAERLRAVVNGIVESSLDAIRDTLDRHWDGSIGIDATPVATYAQGVGTGGTHTATDPDAGWYIRQGDHRDPDTGPDGSVAARAERPSSAARRTAGKPGKHTTGAKRPGFLKHLFGYDATLAIARNPHTDPDDAAPGCGNPALPPALVVGFTLDRPGAAPGRNAVAVLADVRRRGHAAGYLAGDRAYNNADPDTFQLPARALGYRLVFDYRDDQLGIQSGAHGALQVEGRWYCPALPQALIDATRAFRTATPDDAGQAAAAAELYRRHLTARTAYALAPKGRPDGEGHQRLSCPATAGRLQCPLKPASMGTGVRLPLADPAPNPAGPPTICRQHSITLAPEHGAKHAQALPYGSADHQRVYARLRNGSEGFHAYAKDDACEAIQRSQGRRIRGIAAQSLLLAFQLAHANLRKISRWLDSLPGPGGRPRRRVRRRPTEPLATWVP